ncbi:hypothetical protein ACN27G_11775 [Plantactinospora sp. WMMB334]|uniref:hypothetical protein n=1 Tax=Plantactinospora sp. WMMB334 TaxID=3404119 RepID=UPI003B952C73
MNTDVEDGRPTGPQFHLDRLTTLDAGARLGKSSICDLIPVASRTAASGPGRRATCAR